MNANNNTWEALRIKVNTHILGSSTWRSEQRSLIGIIDAAERLEINPDIMEGIQLSQMRTIIKLAKEAIAEDDKKTLEELFASARQNTVTNLRVGLFIADRDVINIAKINEERIRLEMTLPQYLHIQNALKRKYQFIEREAEKPQNYSGKNTSSF